MRLRLSFVLVIFKAIQYFHDDWELKTRLSWAIHLNLFMMGHLTP
jgi:hypothetical protein